MEDSEDEDDVSTAIVPGGDSCTWELQKNNVSRIMDLHLNSKEEFAITNAQYWSVLPEEVVCREKYYERLMGFLVYTYIIAAGNIHAGHHLSFGSVKNFIGTAIQRAYTKFRLSVDKESVAFFTCLNTGSKTRSGAWLTELKRKTKRVSFERSKKAGEPVDNSDSA